jgi:hypothetical protein
MALAELAEKGPDVDMLRQMVQFAAQRLMEAPRRFVWNPTVKIVGRGRALWACGQAAFEPVHMSIGLSLGVMS